MKSERIGSWLCDLEGKNIPGRGNSKDKSIEMRLKIRVFEKRESKCGWRMVRGQEGARRIQRRTQGLLLEDLASQSEGLGVYSNYC